MRYKYLINFSENKGKWFKVFFFVLISSFLYLLPLKLVEIMIDSAEKSVFQILVIGTILIIIYVLSSYVGAYVDYYIDCFAFETSNKVRVSVFDKILMLGKEQFNNVTRGSSFGSLIEDTKIVSECSIKPICLLIKSAISFVGGLVLVTSISPIITIVLLVIGLSATLVNKYMSKKYQEHIHETRESSDRIWNLLNEINEYFITIKLNRRENYYLNKAKDNSNNLLEKEKKEDRHNKKMYAIDTIIFMGTIGVLYVITSILVYYNEMSMGGLVAIMMYNSILIDPLLELSQMVKEYSKTKVSIDRINKYMIDNNIQLPKDIEKKDIKNSIEMKNIIYKNNDKVILNNINLSINIGEKIAIVGESGAGKTTLLYILCGLLNKSSGQIYVDGNLCEDMDEYQNSFSVLLQQAKIYNSNLKDNIYLYTDEWDEKKIESYIHSFELEEIIKTDDNFMIASLNNISGGEEKRIRLISVLAKKAKIICLDELSNSLDNNLCNKIMDEIVKENATVIAIDHRLGLVDKFDKIILINNGKIEQIGTHTELIKSSDLYRKLYESKKSDNRIVEN